MSRLTVTLLEESIDDINAGKRFYEEAEPGIGSYFSDSAMESMGDSPSQNLCCVSL